MRFFIKSLILLLVLSTKLSGSELLDLTGKVSDAVSGEPLAGATISIPELKIAVSTNENGEYNLSRIPSRGRFLVEVRYLGYRTVTQVVDLSTAAPVNFALQPSVIEVHEVVVTGSLSSTDNRSNSTSVSTVSKAEMLSRPGNNIIDAIAHVPGVSQITTGAGISKPVIRGLGSNRVSTLSDGVKQEGQQWGDEHGIELDQYAADRVEILRGAASLQYGSDALGGVINVLDALPPSPGQVKGEIQSNYATNNGLTGTSAMLQGNNKGLVWRGRGTYKNAYSYNTSSGRIANSGFNERDLSAMLGLNKSWGYTHLSLSAFNNKIGIPGDSEDEQPDFYTGNTSRALNLPFQDVRHYKAALNSQLLFNKARLRSTIGYQQNQRRELETSSTDPSLFFDLKTYSSDFKYYFQENKGWEPVLGLAASFQHSQNKAAELLIPDYKSGDIGAFAYIKKSWNSASMNAGLRYDYRKISAEQMFEDARLKFNGFSNSFSNLSGALGFTADITERLSFKTNLGSAFRSPNIAELSSNGVHEGIFRYEIGNNDLKPERSLSADASLEYHTSRVDGHFNVYNNFINNYIYSRQLGEETIEAEGQTLPVYRYVQDDANLSGFEAGLTLHPTKYLHLENTFALTRGLKRAGNSALPFIPAPVLRNEIRVEPHFGSALKNSYVSLGLDNFFAQNHIDSEFETPSKAYSLLNASLGTGLSVGKQTLRLFISGSNLLDKKYTDHLSRLRYVGILNQGRNISLGFQLPLNIK